MATTTSASVHGGSLTRPRRRSTPLLGTLASPAVQQQIISPSIYSVKSSPAIPPELSSVLENDGEEGVDAGGSRTGEGGVKAHGVPYVKPSSSPLFHALGNLVAGPAGGAATSGVGGREPRIDERLAPGGGDGRGHGMMTNFTPLPPVSPHGVSGNENDPFAVWFERVDGMQSDRMLLLKEPNHISPEDLPNPLIKIPTSSLLPERSSSTSSSQLDRKDQQLYRPSLASSLRTSSYTSSRTAPSIRSNPTTITSSSSKLSRHSSIDNLLQSIPMGLRGEHVHSDSYTSLASSLKLTSKFPTLKGRYYNTSYGSKGASVGVGRKVADSDDDMPLLWRAEGVGGAGAGRPRWTPYKWILLLSVITLFAYGLIGLICALLTWFRTWQYADVIVVANADILIYMTLASTICLLTSLLGLTGTILNSRPILAVYNLLLWPAFLSILLVGYTAYKKQTLNLDRKLNQAWSQFFDDLARLRIQNCLRCCGYYNPLHEATFSKRCYPRTSLPGCKGKLYRFEREALKRCYIVTFSIVPLHIYNIIAALLCSNHVSRTFGKGLMPRQYRLNMTDVRENALSVLRSLPSRPPSGLSHSRSISSTRSSISALSSMPGGSGLRGLGLGVGANGGVGGAGAGVVGGGGDSEEILRRAMLEDWEKRQRRLAKKASEARKSGGGEMVQK